jgi:cytochrome c553
MKSGLPEMRSDYGEMRIGNAALNEETSIDICSKQKEAMNRFAQLCAGLCLVASIVAGLASCESTPALQQPVPVAQIRGKAIYQRDCVACHAQQGAGVAFTAVPALAGQRFEYLREQIENFSTDERHSPPMRWAFNRASTKPLQSADDLAAYLSHLPAQRFASGDPRFHAEGEKGYAALCVACHAEDARGNPAGTIPSLRTQQDSYLVNRLRGFASSSPATRIAAHEVDDHTIVAIAAYLSSLPTVDDDSSKPPPP